jgi:hypothetical protein
VAIVENRESWVLRQLEAAGHLVRYPALKPEEIAREVLGLEARNVAGQGWRWFRDKGSTLGPVEVTL